LSVKVGNSTHRANFVQLSRQSEDLWKINGVYNIFGHYFLDKELVNYTRDTLLNARRSSCKVSVTFVLIQPKFVQNFTKLFNIEFVYTKRLAMFPLLTRWNEFAVTPMEEPLDGSVTRSAYRGYTRSK
jgi:hypothetical protein